MENRIGAIIIGVAVGILILGIGIILRSSWENRQLQIKEYIVDVPGCPPALSGVKLVYLSDLHNVSFGAENHQLVEQIKELHPEVILFGGDLIVSKAGEDMETGIHLMQELSKLCPVIYSLGNHEKRLMDRPEEYPGMWEQLKQELQGTVIWSINEVIQLPVRDTTLSILGLDLPLSFYGRFRKKPLSERDMTQLCGECPKEFFVLLAHHPVFFPEYVKYGAKLVLSGHVHGGMVRIPGLGGVISPMFWLFPKYTKGRYTIKDATMLLSGGLGNHTIKIRLFNQPEILSITLK